MGIINKDLVTKERLREARYLISQYEGAKLRSSVYPRKRPTLFTQLKVDLSKYTDHSIVEYDKELAKKIPPEDQEYLRQNLEDMDTVWVVEKAVESMPNEITRGIAADTILKGKRCEDLEEKYHLKACAIRRRKHQTVEFLASICL